MAVRSTKTETMSLERILELIVEPITSSKPADKKDRLHDDIMIRVS